MKFKIGNKVKVNADCFPDNKERIGTIESFVESANSIEYKIKPQDDDWYCVYLNEGNMKLITDKKYITLADIKKHNPCNSKEYVDLLETCGNDFKLTYEQLIKEFSSQKIWIEQHLSEFKEVLVYNGKFKVGDKVYFITGRIGCWDKGSIEKIQLASSNNCY
jgi:hypothetical protein